MAVNIGQPSLCSFLAYMYRAGIEFDGKKILECGAGGSIPPLSLFYERGFETYGIDIDDKQIERAATFERENGMSLNIIKADMQEIPFDDGFFDVVYECQAMCHLTKKDIRQTIAEMHRVLKVDGLCYMTFMSRDHWPLGGKEIADGEFQSHYEGVDYVHSFFFDDEPEGLLTDFEILRKAKQSILYAREWAEMSEDDWMDWYSDDWTGFTRDRWRALYPERTKNRRMEFLEYIVKKGGR